VCELPLRKAAVDLLMAKSSIAGSTALDLCHIFRFIKLTRLIVAAESLVKDIMAVWR